MAEILWADYSWARPDVGKYEGVMRYLDADRGTRPDLTGAEVNDLHQQGKPIGLIWQADKGGAGEGKQRGADDAQRANREADKLGAPDTAAIFYTVDSGSLSPEDVAPYFAGVRGVPGRPVGIYGSARIIEWAHSVGIPWRWQTLAWSSGVISEHAHLYQRDHNVDEGSGLLDRNVKFADFPSWQPETVSKPKEPQSMDIISRAEWGAKPWRSGYSTRPLSRLNRVLIHYHGGEPRNTSGAAVPREIEAIHLANGWSGVGYHFIVAQSGEIFEGRGWDKVGAHCPGHNTDGLGIYIGVGGTQEATPAAKAAARWLYDEACRRTGKSLTKSWHGYDYATACPGPKLIAWVKAGMPVSGATEPAPTVPDADLKAVQALVGVTPDGIDGPATRAAVKDYQAALGLAVDGIAGPITRGALMALQDDIKALSAKIDATTEWARKAVNAAEWSGPARTVQRLTDVLASTTGVDEQALATAIADAIRDDVNAALAGAGPGASADQIADELADELAARLVAKGE